MRRPSTASLIFPYNNIIIRLLRTFQTNLVSVYGQAAENHFFGRCQQNAIASVGNQIWKFVFDSMGDAPRRLFQMDSAFTERTCCIEPFSFFQSKTACCAHRLAHFRSGSDPVYFLPARFRCPYPETAAHLSFVRNHIHFRRSHLHNRRFFAHLPVFSTRVTAIAGCTGGISPREKVTRRIPLPTGLKRVTP